MENLILKKIGNRVKLIRERDKDKLTQKDVANRTNITAGFLSYIESGKKKPSFEFLLDFANEFNVSLDWLILGKGKPFHEDTKIWDIFPKLPKDEKIVEMLEFISDYPQYFYEIISEYLKKRHLQGIEKKKEALNEKKLENY